MPGKVHLTSIAEYRALLQGTPMPPPTPMPQDEADDRPEAVLLAYIQGLAKQYAWQAEHTWNARGKDSGLQCFMYRGTEVVIALVTTAHKKLTMEQVAWYAGLQRTGKVECHTWRPQDRAVIRDRLRRPPT